MTRHDFLLLIVGFFILASATYEFYGSYNAFASRLPRQQEIGLENPAPFSSSFGMESPPGVGYHRPNLSIVDISPSPALLFGPYFDIVNLPAVNLSAYGNNDPGGTSYWINVSSNRFISVFMKGSGDLTTGTGNITLQNEKISYSLVDSTVPAVHKSNLTTQYADNVLAANITGNLTIYLKFYIDAPPNQPPGWYTNDILFLARAV